MTTRGKNEGSEQLRAWLRNERRLGIPILPRSERVPQPQRTPPATRGEAASRDPERSHATASLPIAIGDEGLPPPCDRELGIEEASRELDRIDRQFVRSCRKCVLHERRTRTVFGVGHPRPALVFVGEGPGADEDREGEPFVGRAGQLLTRMIAAMTLRREDVYICNTVKCRPPENRTPTEDEMRTCSPYLWRQLAILRPQIIVALGRPAAQSLLATGASIGSLRGQFHDFPPAALSHFGLPACVVMPTYHPAYLLRSPGEKGKAWDDLKQVMHRLGIAVPGGH